MSVHIREGFSAHRKTKYECTCQETVVICVCAHLQNLYILGSYRNPNSDDTIYDCLLMAMIQDEDQKVAFVFVGDYNAHHREWLGSVSPTDSHGRAALDFAIVSGCSQLVVGATHLAGNRLDFCPYRGTRDSKGDHYGTSWHIRSLCDQFSTELETKYSCIHSQQGGLEGAR